MLLPNEFKTYLDWEWNNVRPTCSHIIWFPQSEWPDLVWKSNYEEGAKECLMRRRRGGRIIVRENASGAASSGQWYYHHHYHGGLLRKLSSLDQETNCNMCAGCRFYSLVFGTILTFKISSWEKITKCTNVRKYEWYSCEVKKE